MGNMQAKEFSPDSSGHVAGVAGRQAATIEEHLPGPFSNMTEIWSLLNSVADPWHFGVDPDPRIHGSDKWIRIRILDPDPAIFVIDLQDARKKLIF
jgi:hypothetical protein